MTKPETLAKLTLYLDYGPVEIHGPAATDLYNELQEKKNIIERNPSQTRYTNNITLADGSFACFNVNKMSGYKYYKGGSPDEQFDKRFNKIKDFVNEHKDKL